MATPESLPVMPVDEVQAVAEALRAAGVRLVVGAVIDSAGVSRGKQVPVDRAGALHRSGVGASSTWAVFCADNGIAMTPRIGAVGDLRLRADLSAAVDVGGGLAWAPAEVFTQDGEPSPVCWRGFLRRQQAAAEALGLEVLAAGEVEFSLLPARPDGTSGPWVAYGLGPALDHQEFLLDLEAEFDRAQLGLEQLHAEYGGRQFEFSLSPADPLRAVDKLALARFLLGRTARRHGLAVSLSPKPFVDGVGNGAHLHMSFLRDGKPLLSAGDGPHGITPEGGSLIAGIVEQLPELTGLLAPSVLSSLRLQPGMWSGAYACWGLENREAAVRLCAATQGNPHGANIEIKCVDPTANPYIAAGAILAAALDGLRAGKPLPPEVTVAPADLTEEESKQLGVVQLPGTHAEALDALERSAAAQRHLGEELLEALVAVRRHEQAEYGDADIATTVDRLRFAWSV
ncbi:glutamine synthetase family protein [Planosporangium flavigriseum]|uniref:Glutamine synthetase n=2 Tax=Planosporangium flavigriseum TaxID=373681 RepID=A0A8J3LR48_9ACTN|nr:glutamine synthetase [Planosporangium flavigriseum]